MQIQDRYIVIHKVLTFWTRLASNLLYEKFFLCKFDFVQQSILIFRKNDAVYTME